MEDTRFESSRKRPRPVVSCLRCREKKLKCDRLLPCQNCTKTPGGSAECTYNHDPTKSIPKSRPSTTSPGARTPDLKNTPNLGNHVNIIQVSLSLDAILQCFMLADNLSS